MIRHLPAHVLLPGLAAIVAVLALMAVLLAHVNAPRRVSSVDVEVAPGIARTLLLPTLFQSGHVYDCTADVSCVPIQLIAYNVERAK